MKDMAKVFKLPDCALSYDPSGSVQERCPAIRAAGQHIVYWRTLAREAVAGGEAWADDTRKLKAAIAKAITAFDMYVKQDFNGFAFNRLKEQINLLRILTDEDLDRGNPPQRPAV